jgi:RNA polymerase sigma-70 factor (ECF subfamily)
MTLMESTPVSMMSLFMERQHEFRQRLRRRLGSDDLVNDVLQETYLRVERMGSAGEGAHNPVGYLFRMALNIAADHREMDARFLTGTEIDDLLHVTNDALDPARVTFGRMEVQMLEDALDELSPRQRGIVIAARLEEASHQDIARRFGISVRMVSKELKTALQHCGDRLERKVVQRFGPGAGSES